MRVFFFFWKLSSSGRGGPISLSLSLSHTPLFLSPLFLFSPPPLSLSPLLRLGFWRFVAAWLLYSLSTGYMLARVAFLEKPLRPSTPRAVFIWFLAAHKLSVAAGVAGYAALVLSMFLAAFGLPALLSDGAGLTLLWYGLYFGVLGRDAAEVAADRTAASLGAGTKLTSSVRQCGLCCGDLVDGLEELVPVAVPPPISVAPPPDAFYRNTFGEKAAAGPLPTPPSSSSSSSSSAPSQPILAARGGVGDATVQLACKHLFHGTCVRGWCVVGKKDTCPCCREKVDLRAVFAGRPWETRNLSWLQMLDMLRYLVVWNPLILGLLSVALRLMGVSAHEAERAALREKLAEVTATHQGQGQEGLADAVGGLAAAGGFGS